MADRTFGDILDAIESARPADAPALTRGRRATWRGLRARSNNLARALCARAANGKAAHADVRDFAVGRRAST